MDSLPPSDPTTSREPAPGGAVFSPSTAPSRPPAGDLADQASLARELKSQQFLMRILLVVLVVLLTTSSMALFHQVRWLGAQASQLRATAIEFNRLVGNHDTNIAPHLARMATELRRFAESNPEFARTFSKYRVTLAGSGATNAPAPAPPAR